MSNLQQMLTRFLGGNTRKVTPEDAELQRLLSEGDDARRQQDFERALSIYQKGLEYAQTHQKPFARSAFLGQIGSLHAARKNFAAASEAFNEAKKLADESNDPQLQARAMLNLGAFHLRQNELEKSQSLLEQSLDIARKHNDQVIIGLALGNLADVHLKSGNPSYALRLLKDAAPQMIAQGGQASYLFGRIGQAYLRLKDLDQGKKYLAQAGQLAQQHEQIELELMWGCALADQLYEENRIEEALRLYEGAEQIAARVVNPPEEYNPLRSLMNRADAYQRLQRPQDAIRLAELGMEQARADQNRGAEARLTMILGSAYQSLGRAEEAIRAYEEVLRQEQPSSQLERTRALIQLGGLYYDQKQEQKALEYFNQALENSGTEDHLGRAHTLRRMGTMEQAQGNLPKALERWTEALSLFETANDHAQAARLLCDIGGIRRSLSGINAAMSDFERATVLLSQVKDAPTRGVVLSNIANLYTDLGEVETARSFYEESIDLARRSSNRRAESLRLGNFGWYHLMIGNYREAVSLLEDALRISRELGENMYIAVQTNNLGQAHHEQKHYQKAEALYQEALNLVAPDSKWAGLFRSNWGRTLLAQGKTDEAITMLSQALEISRKHNDRETISRTLARLGESYLRADRVTEAESAATEAQAIAGKMAYRKGQADALMVKASVAQKQGDTNAYLRFIKEAYRLYNILHDPLAHELEKIIGV